MQKPVPMADRSDAAPGSADLPDVLEYTGEFGPELVLFLPFIRHLCATDAIGARTVRTYAGMAPFYEGLPIAVFEEKTAQRHWVPNPDRPAWLPRRSEHDFDGLGPSDELSFPDPRRQFAHVPMPGALDRAIASKPLVVIHNKVTDEWGQGPVNRIGLGTLRRILPKLMTRFTVVYIRHGASKPPQGYSEDHNTFLAFRDMELLARFPGVFVFDDLYKGQTEVANVNAFKAGLYARCFRFITVQGGGAHQIAQYSGSVMVILHRLGDEMRFAYAHGCYTFMTSPAPLLLTCAYESELKAAVGALLRSNLRDGRISLDSADADLARRLSPETIERRGAPFHAWIAFKRRMAKRKKRWKKRMAKLQRRFSAVKLPGAKRP